MEKDDNSKWAWRCSKYSIVRSMHFCNIAICKVIPNANTYFNVRSINKMQIGHLKWLGFDILYQNSASKYLKHLKIKTVCGTPCIHERRNPQVQLQTIYMVYYTQVSPHEASAWLLSCCCCCWIVVLRILGLGAKNHLSSRQLRKSCLVHPISQMC